MAEIPSLDTIVAAETRAAVADVLGSLSTELLKFEERLAKMIDDAEAAEARLATKIAEASAPPKPRDGAEPMLEHFEYAHLPEGLMRETSRGFSVLALIVTRDLPPSAERTVALRKLLEGKDAAVRAARLAIKAGV